jgi:hypothetical protein
MISATGAVVNPRRPWPVSPAAGSRSTPVASVRRAIVIEKPIATIDSTVFRSLT